MGYPRHDAATRRYPAVRQGRITSRNKHHAARCLDVSSSLFPQTVAKSKLIDGFNSMEALSRPKDGAACAAPSVKRFRGFFWLLTRTRQWHLLRAARGVVGDREGSRAQSFLRRGEGDLDQATCSRQHRAAAFLLAGEGKQGEVSAGRDVADVQRRASRVGESGGLGAARHTHYHLAPRQRSRRQNDGRTTDR